jgi:hypothetical protein
MEYRYYKILVVALLANIALGNNLYAQVDSSAKSFFPAAIGNSWHYQTTPSHGYITTITRDSLADGKRYIFMDDSNIPTYVIDTLFNIIKKSGQGSYEELLYKLDAKIKETWISYSRPGLRITARVENVTWGFVLGVFTQIKRIGYYYQPLPDTTNYSQWRNDNYIAAGIGYYMQITEGMQTTAEELYGCIIEGKKIGIMTSVNENLILQSAHSYKLNPAFPNPFNPSTIISFQLPESDIVSIKVYDLLGREIVTLVDEKQNKGNYQIQFRPNKLSSGIYLVRMSAGKYTQTNKIIYSK